MKIKKIICIGFIFLLLLILLGNHVSAFSIGNLRGNTVSTSEIEEVGNKVVQIVSTVGSIISVIVIIVLGIKYMMGSVEERADYKKTMIPFLIGAVFIFAASSIASVIYNVAKNL